MKGGGGGVGGKIGLLLFGVIIIIGSVDQFLTAHEGHDWSRIDCLKAS